MRSIIDMLTALFFFPLLLWVRDVAAGASSQLIADRLMDCYNYDMPTKKQPHPELTGTFSGFLKGIPANLVLHQVFWPTSSTSLHHSTLPEPSPPSSVEMKPLTVVTVATSSRLDALEAQCASWGGPLAAAVYVPVTKASPGASSGTHKSIVSGSFSGSNPLKGVRYLLSEQSVRLLKQVEEKLQGLLKRTQANTSTSRASSSTSASATIHSKGGCHLRLLLLYEIISSQPAGGTGNESSSPLPPPAVPPAVPASHKSEESSSPAIMAPEPVETEMMRSLLPINSLRNAAMLAADTDMVAMIDVDLLISKDLSTDMSNTESVIQLVRATTQQNKLIILPAFETIPKLTLEHGLIVAQQAAAGGKAAIVDLVDKLQAITFASTVYAKGHACTDFKKWYSSGTPYNTTLTSNCEPWFMVSRFINPEYDVRFRGYGWNKVQQVAHVASLPGVSLLVHPTGFIIHRPHNKSAAMSFYAKGKLATGSQINNMNHSAGGLDVGMQVTLSREAALRALGKSYHRRVNALRAQVVLELKCGTYVYTAGCFRVETWDFSSCSGSEDRELQSYAALVEEITRLAVSNRLAV
ncbi:hypothetical protein CEUSTIGMA_g62.t1 [Chlamydomonas eustigma]|uniref:Uncharacterized protein n=1 Tax=Chlamydomonas eustigma TaxID=1157962 RepID=A0A250WPI4_9CHLO|nr:hypothetical protein CEUSTIGMA_g62.t1 [Chlamydomonas eustigma]|eukprot:GAX72606.1 hypothetical protein CEUSTIGMA_g62.t1 [Chlamydomonas eustigma]